MIMVISGSKYCRDNPVQMLIPNRWALRYALYAAKHGVAPDQFMKACNLPKGHSLFESGFLTLEQLNRMNEVLPRITKVETCFLQMSANPTLDRLTIKPLYLRLSMCASFDEFVDVLIRYHKLIHPFAGLKLVRKGPLSKLYYIPLNDSVQIPCYAELFMGSCLTFLRVLKSNFDFAPVKAAFNYDQPAYVDAYQKHFNAPLEYNAKQCCLTFNTKDLVISSACTDPEWKGMVEDHINQKHYILPGVSLRDQISRLIEYDLVDSLDDAARYLKITCRTLQRELACEKTSFRQIKNKILFDRSKKLLSQNELSIQEVAEQLHFSSLSSFYNTFKRWSRMTPAAFRKQAS